MIARAAASLILAGALATATAGCTFVSEQATLIQYDPSDGVGATIGDLAARNMIALISEDGTQISLLVSFINTGDSAVTVAVQSESDGEPVTTTKSIEAGATDSYGNTGEAQFLIGNPGITAGALYPVYLQVGSEPGQQVLVPVLDGSLAAYADLVPAGIPVVSDGTEAVTDEATSEPTTEPTTEATTEPTDE